MSTKHHLITLTIASTGGREIVVARRLPTTFKQLVRVFGKRWERVLLESKKLIESELKLAKECSPEKSSLPLFRENPTNLQEVQDWTRQRRMNNLFGRLTFEKVRVVK